MTVTPTHPANRSHPHSLYFIFPSVRGCCFVVVKCVPSTAPFLSPPPHTLAYFDLYGRSIWNYSIMYHALFEKLRLRMTMLSSLYLDTIKVSCIGIIGILHWLGFT